MPTYRCTYCQKHLGAAPLPRCPHCGKAMMLPKDKRQSQRKQKSRPLEDDEPANLPLMHFGKKPTILGAIILVFLVLGTLLTSRFETAAPPGMQNEHLADRARREVNALAMALQRFHQDTGRYPLESEGLPALVRNPGVSGWGGHYVNLIQPDPWKTPYRYHVTPLGPEVRSAGPDRTFHTDADISATVETIDKN